MNVVNSLFTRQSLSSGSNNSGTGPASNVMIVSVPEKVAVEHGLNRVSRPANTEYLADVVARLDGDDDRYGQAPDRPGQTPGMEQRVVEIDERSFGNSFWGCFSGKWLLACFCPCMSFGRVYHRLHHPEDPDMVQYSACCNGACWLYWWACNTELCASNCLGTFQRRHLRQKLNIRGNGCKDGLAHWFCTCCALVQEERELEDPMNREILLAEKGHNYDVRRQPRHRHEDMEYPAGGNQGFEGVP